MLLLYQKVSFSADRQHTTPLDSDDTLHLVNLLSLVVVHELSAVVNHLDAGGQRQYLNRTPSLYATFTCQLAETRG